MTYSRAEDAKIGTKLSIKNFTNRHRNLSLTEALHKIGACQSEWLQLFFREKSVIGNRNQSTSRSAISSSLHPETIVF